MASSDSLSFVAFSFAAGGGSLSLASLSVLEEVSGERGWGRTVNYEFTGVHIFRIRSEYSQEIRLHCTCT